MVYTKLNKTCKNKIVLMLAEGSGIEGSSTVCFGRSLMAELVIVGAVGIDGSVNSIKTGVAYCSGRQT